MHPKSVTHNTSFYQFYSRLRASTLIARHHQAFHYVDTANIVYYTRRGSPLSH